MKQTDDKKGLKIMLAISLLVFVIAIGWAGYQGYTIVKYNQAIKAEQKRLEEEEAKRPSLEDVQADTVFGGRQGESALIPDGIHTEDSSWPIDFYELVSINKELVAWITIDDTNIDYPIARPKNEQDYYIYHDLYGYSSYGGCIYMERCNSSHFVDNKNTIVYGNNMADGTMFQNLFKFQDESFLNAHPYIQINTPYNNLKYEIFAVYLSDDTNLSDAYDFDNPEVFEKYLEKVKNAKSMNTIIRDQVKVGCDDCLLTLSTCTSDSADSRLLVQAVLVENESTGK